MDDPAELIGGVKPDPFKSSPDLQGSFFVRGCHDLYTTTKM